MSMPNSIIKTPFLITTRKFAIDDQKLQSTITKMYFEIAYAVNHRTISLYEKFQTNTGERWFNTGDPTNRLQAFRQVYTAPSILNGTTIIPTGIPIDSNTIWTHIYGTAQSNFAPPTTNYAIPLPYVNTTTPADSITLRVNLTTGNIEIVTTTGNWTGYSAIVVLEYILNN